MKYQYGVQCHQCGEVIYSNSRHDFVDCGCGATFVDGGFDYMRVGGDPVLNPTNGNPRRRRRRLSVPPPHHFRDEK